MEMALLAETNEQIERNVLLARMALTFSFFRIRPSIHPSIHPFIHPSIHLCQSTSIRKEFLKMRHEKRNPIHPSIHPFIHVHPSLSVNLYPKRIF